MASEVSRVIPNLDKVKIEAEGRCYLPTRLRGHGRVLARCLNLGRGLVIIPKT